MSGYNLDQLTNAPQPVTIAGRVFQVRQLRLSEWGELQAWLKSVAPSPVAVATKALAELRQQGVPVPPDVQSALFQQAQEESRRWPPRVGTGAWLRALEDVEGGRARFIVAALAPGGNVLTMDEASEIEQMASVDELADLMRVCLTGEHLVPKAPGATMPQNQTIGASGSKLSE